MKDAKNVDYLGDGVYADYDGYSITLMTGNHIYPDNTIVLEPQVLLAFTRYLKRMRDNGEKETENDFC